MERILADAGMERNKILSAQTSGEIFPCVEVKAKPDDCGCQNRTVRKGAEGMHFSQ